MPDRFEPCPCGSGKKFKWCCEAFYGDLERARSLVKQGQQAAADRIMDRLLQEHGDNAEVWGQRATQLAARGDFSGAEECLDRAIELQPNYAYGFFLRGQIADSKGETEQARSLFRKATDVCPPEARQILGVIWTSIANLEMSRGCMIAACKAVEYINMYLPEAVNVNEALEETIHNCFASAHCPGSLPTDLKPPTGQLSAEVKESWDEATAAIKRGKLTRAAEAFERITGSHPDFAVAWYNLALVHAWMGDVEKAIQAIEHYVTIEPDDVQAAEAFTLAEQLRFTLGFREESDYAAVALWFPVSGPERLSQFVSDLDPRMVFVHQAEDGLMGFVLDRPLVQPDNDVPAYEVHRVLGCSFLGPNGLVVLTRPGPYSTECRNVVEECWGAALGPATEQPAALVTFQVIALFLNLLPLKTPPKGSEKAQRLLSWAEHFLGQDWPRRSLKSLGGLSPQDAVATPIGRRKVLGCLRFLEAAAEEMLPKPVVFNEIRRQLGLPTATADEDAEPAIADLGQDELAKVDIGSLSDAELVEAFQSARRCDWAELAERFAKAAVDRQPTADQSDRYALYSFLAQTAIERGEWDQAAKWLEAGSNEDDKANAGRRNRDYRLRQAQLHIRAAQPEEAHRIYTQLAEKTPGDMDVLGTATEAMLSAGMPDRAARFAQQGLDQAKAKGDRDRVGYFEELLSAAKAGV